METEEKNEECIYIPDTQEQIDERLALAWEGIEGMSDQQDTSEKYKDYFMKQAQFCLMIREHAGAVANGSIRQMSLNELRLMNNELYSDITPDHYDTSYTNPVYTSNLFGKELGQLLSFLAAETRAMISSAYQGDKIGIVIRLELLLEIYGIFRDAAQDDIEIKAKYVKSAMYWYVSDYAEYGALHSTVSQVNTDDEFVYKLIMESDLSDIRYLFYTGEYISKGIEHTAAHIAELPTDKVDLMADTFTEGFKNGFKMMNKDITKVKSVNIRGQFGFERFYVRAVKNFEKMGFKVAMSTNANSIFAGYELERSCIYGANPNKQYDFDHREDLALFLDGRLVTRKLEGIRASFEEHREQAAVYGGPAVLLIFGEKDFEPVSSGEIPAYNDEQKKLSASYTSKATAAVYDYVVSSHRCFTIISFPSPEIGVQYKEIFDEIVKINSLESAKYAVIQQSIIDALDQGIYAEVKGKDGNKTDLKIMLHELKDPAHQSNFENCVADVNIPVGEVFTSPVLEGTNGVLNVKKVFINGLEYRDLLINVKEGMAVDYDCSNFSDHAADRKLIDDNIMFHHGILPMGEFAIGTNTIAYVAARKFDIESKLDILIAEKTGPHFAFGDTCYSRDEDNKTWNPDGKELIARSNSISDLRKSEPDKAYFGCHTDITIPYDELGSIEAVRADGSRITIIKDGRFVLPGTEELNKAFDAS